MNSKKKIFGLCIGVLILGMGMPVMADTTSRKANLKSTGSINFENGAVYVTASDLIYLADEIDNLENTYKRTSIDALNDIGTFFLSDGTTVNDSAGNVIDTDEEKSGVAFGKIIEGIKKSQSVDSLLQTQATDKEGNLLFYETEEAQTNKDVHSMTTIDTGFPVFYQPANTNNLSAGTAAWVGGNLIKGNGADNASYYEQGYRIGYADAMANVGNATINYIRHYHDSTSSCYVPPIMRGYDKYIGDDLVNTQYHVAECSICGRGKWNYKDDWNFGTHICVPESYNCGHYHGEIIGAEIIY